MKSVPSNAAAGKIASVTYFPCGIRAYHAYKAGKKWIPTAPIQAEETSRIEIQDLSLRDFMSNLPNLTFENSQKRRWFPESAFASGYTIHDKDVAIEFKQEPSIEGNFSFGIRGKLVRAPTFLDGMVVLEFRMSDYFGFGRKLRIYHNGHSAAALGIQHSLRYNSISCISSDGVRTRFLYRPNRIRLQTATAYNTSPSNLYLLRSPEGYKERHILNPLHPDFVLEVCLRRKLESNMLAYGNAYDHGTIGAEVAFSIASKMLMNDQLLILEPAMRGSDLVSRDKSVAVEARMLAGSRPRTESYINHEVASHMRHMLGRLRWGLSRKAFRRGIAILSLRLEDQHILASVKEA